MTERRERPERETPFNILPNLKKLSPEFSGIFIILAVIFILFFYWNPFSSGDETSSKQAQKPLNENIPIPLKAPSDTVLIIDSGTESSMLGEYKANYAEAEKKLSEIRDYFNDAKIGLDEYKRGSIVKTEWLSEIRTGVAVRLVFLYDAAGGKITAFLHEKRAEDGISGSIDSRSVYGRIASKVFKPE